MQARRFMSSMLLFMATALMVSSVSALPAPENLKLVTGSTTGWHKGRDTNGYLVVDGGSVGEVNFELERVTHCSTKNSCIPCDVIVFDKNVDGYKGRPPGSCRVPGACPESENDDLMHVSGDYYNRHYLIKNVTIKNGFKTKIGPHVDLIQLNNATDYSGWIVLQNVDLTNSDDQHLLGTMNNSGIGWNNSTTCETGATMQGLVLQDVVIKQETWFNSDCAARAQVNGDPYCGTPTSLGAWSPMDLWLVNVQTNGTGMSIGRNWSDIVIIGIEPPVSYAGDFSGKIYRYNSIEEALADGRSEPAFIRLNCSGWANTANCIDG